MDTSSERSAPARSGDRQVLFVQGAGAGTHDEWDHALVDSLRRGLGPGYEVRYPRMPQEDDPSYARWSAAIRDELDALDEGALVVGHSIGATILVQALTEHPPPYRLAAIVLIAAPFVGPGGWPGEDLQLAADLGAHLPAGVPVHVFHGTLDETAPPSHARLYADAIAQARVHLLTGMDHQLGSDLRDVARTILEIARGRPRG
ncbi:MAG: alpha/beta fold hydrolase [Cellulomonadaceae bacterium]|nr:alpha/beta fold hydrolase [Cellulomonadaceae bacterium]